MADTINFDTGLKTFDVNGQCEITFNPYDIFFLGKVTDAAEKLDKLQSELQTAGDDWAIVYAKSKETDSKMRAVIDGLFGMPVCDAVFPDISVFAVGDGFPVWANFLYAIMDKMDSGLDAEKEKSKKRLQKYTEKYKR